MHRSTAKWQMITTLRRCRSSSIITGLQSRAEQSRAERVGWQGYKGRSSSIITGLQEYQIRAEQSRAEQSRAEQSVLSGRVVRVESGAGDLGCKGC